MIIIVLILCCCMINFSQRLQLETANIYFLTQFQRVKNPGVVLLDHWFFLSGFLMKLRSSDQPRLGIEEYLSGAGIFVPSSHVRLLAGGSVPHHSMDLSPKGRTQQGSWLRPKQETRERIRETWRQKLQCLYGQSQKWVTYHHSCHMLSVTQTNPGTV